MGSLWGKHRERASMPPMVSNELGSEVDLSLKRRGLGNLGPPHHNRSSLIHVKDKII
jgi:hypothetical protein